MANWIIFNKINRRLHFFASIFIVVFALFYAFTGLIMSKYEWFPADEINIMVDRHALNYKPDTTNLANFGNEIKQQFALSGRMEYRHNNDNSISYLIVRPGIRNEILVHQDLDSIVIKRIENISIHEIAKRLHRTYGFKGGWIYVLWATMYDITAFAFILFAITGLIIWFKHRKIFRWGWVVLLPAMILALIMIYYLH
ncbi:MAG TPA: PepSY-associated TM helix domain-containing protein [Prolixibacteraceae bacterium]|jgi:hypothetical protein